jgi:DUF438 domain-containing protein
MNNFDWAKEAPLAITVTNKDGVIVYMNDRSKATFEKQGGASLIGKALNDCHKPSSVEKIKEISETLEPNSYTILKNGQKKMIYQTPYYDNGEFAGLIEFSFIIPEEMPHFIR